MIYPMEMWCFSVQKFENDKTRCIERWKYYYKGHLKSSKVLSSWSEFLTITIPISAQKNRQIIPSEPGALWKLRWSSLGSERETCSIFSLLVISSCLFSHHSLWLQPASWRHGVRCWCRRARYPEPVSRFRRCLHG